MKISAFLHKSSQEIYEEMTKTPQESLVETNDIQNCAFGFAPTLAGERSGSLKSLRGASIRKSTEKIIVIEEPSEAIQPGRASEGRLMILFELVQIYLTID
jgi:hypothetical protein